MTNPLALYIANAVEDKQDALLNTWIIAWVGHALSTDPLNLFNANIFYPHPNALAFSETMLPQGLFALPFNLAFDNTLLGYNLILLASFFLAAYAMYLFVFDLTRDHGAAIVAGTIFAFNPYNLGNLAQVQLLSFGWTPLVMMYLRRMLAVDHRPSTAGHFRFSITDFRLACLFALFFSLQALSSFYYAFLIGFAVTSYVIWDFIVYHPRWSAFVRVLFSAVLSALLVLPFFLPYLQAQREMGFERKITESEPFSASLKLYTEVSPQNVLYGNLLAPRPPTIRGSYPLDNLFPGVIALALATTGLLAAQDRERWFYVFLFAFAFVFSFGPRLFITPTLGTDIPLPYRWLYDLFPLTRALRAPVRFDALVMLALAALAAFGIHYRTTLDHQPPTIVQHFLPSAVCLLIVLEYLALPAAHVTPVPTGDEIPEYVHWLAKQPHGVVLELPMIASEPTQPLDLTTQYFTTYHWHQTPDGYSGFNPPRRGEIAYEMQFFPSERALSLLDALDVRYVVLRDARTHAEGLEFVQQFGDTRVYRLAPRAQTAPQLNAQVYLPNPATPNQTYSAYIVVTNRAEASFAIKPTTRLRIEAQWNDGTTQHTTATMPLVTSRVSVVPVKLLAPPHRGTQRLDLRATSDAIGAWDLSGEVMIADGEPAHQVVLPVWVALAAPLKTSYAPGDSIAIALTWQALNKIDAYYSASVRVVDARGDKIIAQDREPVAQTFLWQPGDTIPDRFQIELPRDLAPGQYSLQVKMYQADQGVDALLLDEQFIPNETIELGRFIVN